MEVFTMKNTFNLLNYAMEMKKNGHDFYDSFKDQVKNPTAKKVLENLAKVHKDHYHMIKETLDDFSKEENYTVYTHPVNPLDWTKNKERLDKEKIGPHGEDLAIMAMAYEVQHHFTTLYNQGLKQTQDPNSKQILKNLLSIEEDHEASYYNAYRSLMSETWHNANFAPF
jgi:bacterioferritin (cytochrome b1)